MRIKFDYNNVDPDTVALVLKTFMQNYEQAVFTNDNGEETMLEFGSVNVYITLRNKKDHSPVVLYNKSKDEAVWTVKQHRMKRTNKTELLATDDFIIYGNR